MSPKRSIDSSNFASEIVALLAGGGILTMLLFPFAVPLLILTAAAAAVLALPLLPVALVAASYLALRAAWRRLPRRPVRAAAAISGSRPARPNRIRPT